jgi:2-polyprenyl-3-methyl-5-hydroxy-6-metoxy-1,4-benzoquinol methylase
MAPELVDQPAPDPALLGESLADLAWLNRYLGGTATILHQLRKLIGDGLPEGLRVLDVGAGGADILVTMGRWCMVRGLGFEGTAVDYGAEVVRAAASLTCATANGDSIRVVRADARAIPARDREFDVTFCSTFLHHLARDDAIAVLREMARVSSLGIIVSDLRRCRSGYLAAWTLANTVWRSHGYTRHDATVSMRGAYSLGEARCLAARAGLEAEIEPQLWFRWALRWRRPA